MSGAPGPSQGRHLLRAVGVPDCGDPVPPHTSGPPLAGHFHITDQTNIGKQTMTTEDVAVDALLRTLVSPASDDHLRHIFNEGATPKQLAAASGRSLTSVNSKLKATGVDLRGPDHGLYMRLRRSLSPESNEKELRRAYEAGISASLMSTTLETDWPTLRARLEKAGTRIRPQPRVLHPSISVDLRPLLFALPPDASGAQMRLAYETGASLEILSTFTDHSPSRVHHLLEEAGTELRSRHIAAMRSLPTKATAEQLHEKYQDGVPITQLSKHTGYSMVKIFDLIGEATKALTKRQRATESDDATSADGSHLLARLSPNSTRKQIAAAYKAGASTPKIAERVDVHYSTVRNWLKQHGVTLRPSGNVKPPAPEHALSFLHRDSPAEELKALYLQEVTISDLAKATGRSTSWVRRQLHLTSPPILPPAHHSATTSKTVDQEVSPLVAQQRLVQRLMALRSKTGLTKSQVAEELGVPVSMVFRSEALPVVCSPRFLRALGTYYNLSEQEQRALLRLRAEGRTQGWWVHQGLEVPTDDCIRVGLRGDVCQVFGWAPTLVPELAQTAEYAQAVESQLRPAHQADQPESTVALLTALQSRVRRRGIVQRYVVDESVLRRRVGDTAIMVRQLEALSALARRGRLRVLAHFGPMPGVYEEFELCTIPGLDEQVVYFPQRRQIQPGAPLPFGHTLESLQHVMKRLWESAASPEDSLELIEQARAQMGTDSVPPLHHKPLVLPGPPARQQAEPATAHAHRSAGEG